MHEYGHTFDSQIWGPLYLASVGVFSAHSAETSQSVPGTVNSTHAFKWYEMSANRHVANYFGQHYGVDWNGYYKTVYPNTGWSVDYSIEDYYPRKKKK